MAHLPKKPLMISLYSLNTPTPSLALNVPSDDQYSVRKSDDQYSTPDPTRPLGTGWQPRTKTSAHFRRIRAIEKGYYIPKTNNPQNAFIEVPKALVAQAKDMIKGKILNQKGTPHGTPIPLNPPRRYRSTPNERSYS